MATIYYYRNKHHGNVIETSSPRLWESMEDYERIPAKEGRAAIVEEARKQLLDCLKPGQTVYTILRHVSASGMRRQISLFTTGIDEKGPYMQDLTFRAARLLNRKRGTPDGIIIDGCGMDMGFQLVYQLGCALWPNGTPEPHGTRNGEPDTAGGYALKHTWL